MFDQFTTGTSRRDVLRASAVGVGASLGLVGSASASDHVVEFDESIAITPEDSGKTFVQTADFEGRVNIRPGVENVTVDGNGYTISGGGISGGSYEGTITDLTLQNLHLSDGGFGFGSPYKLVIRNNVADGLAMGHASNVRVVDNTFDRSIVTDENLSDVVFARNVATGVEILDDPSDSIRLANNFFMGREKGPCVSLQVSNVFDGRLEILDNYIANAGGPGILLDDSDLKPIVSRNVVVGNGGHGVDAADTGVAKMEENVFIGNEGHGVDALVGTFRNNFATSNDGDGFVLYLSGRGDCLRNAAISNGGAGFRVGGGDAKFGFNCATGNDGDGVVLDGASSLGVRKNAINGNGGDGLVLEDATDNGVTRNRICGNDGEELVVGDDADDDRFANNLIC